MTLDDVTTDALGYGAGDRGSLWDEYAVGLAIAEASARLREQAKRESPQYLANARARYRRRRDNDHYMAGCRARAAASKKRRGLITGAGNRHVGNVERIEIDRAQIKGRQKKLGAVEVAAILASTEQTGVLAKRYGVSRHAILYYRRKRAA